jgi:hypothetical protein
MRFMRDDVIDPVACQKNDHGALYRRCEASQSQSLPEIKISRDFWRRSIFDFSTASVWSDISHWDNSQTADVLRKRHF